MFNNKLFLTFSTITLLIWSSSWWAYRLFLWVDGQVYGKRFFRMEIIIAGIIFILFLEILVQLFLLIKNKARLIPLKVFLNILGILFVGFYAFLVSIMQENTWGLIKANVMPLRHLITVILAADGLDVLFLFFLAFISGHIIYYGENKFSGKRFVSALLIWFVIIFINEMVIQEFLVSSFRIGSLTDVFHNMLGGVFIGLLLSSRWFYN